MYLYALEGMHTGYADWHAHALLTIIVIMTAGVGWLIQISQKAGVLSMAGGPWYHVLLLFNATD